MIKTLLKEVKEYKKDTLLSPVYVSIEAILEVLIPSQQAFFEVELLKLSDVESEENTEE